MPATLPHYAFGPFELQPAERRLLRDGHVVDLPSKAFDVLAVLVARPGHLITKGELMEAVWPGVVVVPQAAANQVVALLKDYDARESKMIPIIQREKSMLKALEIYGRY